MKATCWQFSHSLCTLVLVYVFCLYDTKGVCAYPGVGNVNVKCFYDYQLNRFVLQHPEEIAEVLPDFDKRILEKKEKKKLDEGGNLEVGGLPGVLFSLTEQIEKLPKNKKLAENKKKYSRWVSLDGSKTFKHKYDTAGKSTWLEYHDNKYFATFKEVRNDSKSIVAFDKTREMWIKLVRESGQSQSSAYWARAKTFRRIRKWSHLHDGTWT
mmetsp:Transcript_19393/g.25256  ORF Transcript_19393/g.25256 Transcript_19393/m.25256 type:complete len:211 (+) Transcript_19393:159-791(+)